MANLVGADLTRRLRRSVWRSTPTPRLYARARGIIIADTKFEFGQLDGRLILIDEALTPDSSRFWPADAYRPGGPQPSFDKQYLRDYLESTGWNKQPPPPPLPPDVIRDTATRYREAYQRLVE